MVGRCCDQHGIPLGKPFKIIKANLHAAVSPKRIRPFSTQYIKLNVIKNKPILTAETRENGLRSTHPVHSVIVDMTVLADPSARKKSN